MPFGKNVNCRLVGLLLQVWQTLLCKPPSALVILDFEADLQQLRKIFNDMSVSQAKVRNITATFRLKC